MAADVPEYISEAHQRIAEFANDFIDDDDERAEFVDSFLERTGHERVTAWRPPADQPPSPGRGKGWKAPAKPPAGKGGKGGGSRGYFGGSGR